MGWLGKPTTLMGVLGLGLGLAGCGALDRWPLLGAMETVGVQEATEAVVVEPAIAPEAPEAAAEAQAIPNPPAAQNDTFRQAVNRASSAVAIGQSAQSASDWELAATRWQQAIALMQQVPSHSPNHGQAQAKVREYQQYLSAAQRRAAGERVAPANPTTTATPPQAPAPQAANGLVAQVPIQRRQGGTPVVAVTIHGQQGAKTFPMLFDTGATGTLITAEMAQAAGVVVVGETRARIADGSVVTLPVGYVDAIELGGLRKESVRVAIGGSYGLLGQDIYGTYGIAIGSHQINLHQ
jgi:predicted aspartyl protease